MCTDLWETHKIPWEAEKSDLTFPLLWLFHRTSSNLAAFTQNFISYQPLPLMSRSYPTNQAPVFLHSQRTSSPASLFLWLPAPTPSLPCHVSAEENKPTDLAISSFLRSSVVYDCSRGIPSNFTSSSLGKEFNLSMSSQQCRPAQKERLVLTNTENTSWIQDNQTQPKNICDRRVSLLFLWEVGFLLTMCC